jgi:hypothetical protein
MTALGWIAVGASALIVLGGGTATTVAIVRDEKKRSASAPITSYPAPDGGTQPVLPSTIAAKVGLPVDVYSAARVAASEAGTGSEAEKAAVIWVAINQCRHLGKSLTAGVCSGKGAGLYGAQNAGSRWISTRLDPTATDVDIAQRVLAGKLPDNTGGARKFLHPATQDALAKKAAKGYGKTAAVVIADWEAEGFRAQSVPGVPSSRFLVFTKAAGAARVS